jgi:hypothetical protein
MRFLKLFLISLIVLLFIVIFLFALIPSELSVSRVVRIQAGQERLAEALTDLSSWPSWNRFLNEQVPSKIIISSKTGSAGASLHAGQLTVRLTSVAKDTITSVWSNSRGKQFTSVFLLMPAAEGGSYIQWKFNFHLNWYPWEKLGSMFYDRQLGPVMEKSLLELQHYVDKNP